MIEQIDAKNNQSTLEEEEAGFEPSHP